MAPYRVGEAAMPLPLLRRNGRNWLAFDAAVIQVNDSYSGLRRCRVSTANVSDGHMADTTIPDLEVAIIRRPSEHLLVAEVYASPLVRSSPAEQNVDPCLSIGWCLG